MFHHEEFRIFEKRNKRYKKLGRERFAEEIRKYKQKNKRKKKQYRTDWQPVARKIRNLFHEKDKAGPLLALKNMQQQEKGRETQEIRRCEF